MPNSTAHAWLTFWTVALIVAGTVFAAITLIVAVRGGAELVSMFRRSGPGKR